ncbi:hypothetical protein MASR2M18_08740 [Ignavibacteria bacterium]|nr:hypothetical protein [Bacteroidota bacterium]MCZ2133680.1 hypothetical protein [Bacteroidota bacterium]
MAKQQSFGDKTKKKTADSRITVKVIKGYRSDSGSMKYLERLVKVEDTAAIEKLDITR